MCLEKKCLDIEERSAFLQSGKRHCMVAVLTVAPSSSVSDVGEATRGGTESMLDAEVPSCA